MAHESFEACVAACLACMRDSVRCADVCASHPEFHVCERACRKCFAACVLWLADLHDGVCGRPRTRLACASACEVCADACDQHQGAAFQKCAKAARVCAEACRKASATSSVLA
jgi:hypothetical protein